MRVAVTTASDSYACWEEALHSVGLEPLSLPCIEVHPAAEPILADARRRAAAADLLFVTSARAVRILWPAGGFPSSPAAAVGEATAAAVEQAGGIVAVCGDGDGDDLVDLVIDGVSGRRVFFPAARHADSARGRRLSAAGAHLDVEAVYATVPIAPGADPADAVVFGSPSSIEGWEMARRLDEVPVTAVMGSVTAAALRQRGREPDVIPERPSVAAIARGLANLMERTS
ncbi:MAG TPA: uroporphyrinogen-III synthase [Acidimicrobiia bacterium]|nr:uroporphyrinogen-III synthase [Acidimicrobiia bacterium]